MASRKPLTDSSGEVRELTAQDRADAEPFPALPESEREMLMSLGKRSQYPKPGTPEPTAGPD
jgi:hypothetical protein